MAVEGYPDVVATDKVPVARRGDSFAEFEFVPSKFVGVAADFFVLQVG